MTLISNASRAATVALGLLLLGPCLGARPALAMSSNQVYVEKSHAKRISLKAQAGSVIVGSPEIADVNIIDSYTIYVVGRGYGSSSITVTDRMGRAIYDGEIIVSAPNQGAVTVYSGKSAVLMVCNQVCVPQDINANTLGQIQTSSPNTSYSTGDNDNMIGLNPIP